MALRDLVASKASLKEADIEAIVADFVRYDEDHKEIVFTPSGNALPARKKVLIYLVALQGWPFIAAEVSTDASPSEIADHLGIPGGTARPMLMDLRDRNLIAVKDRRYSVRAANLHSVKAELDGQGVAKSTKTKEVGKQQSPGSKFARKRDRPRSGGSTKSGSQSAKFDGWITAGFFDEPRALADVQKKFRQTGVIVPRTSIPSLLLKAVRDERLSRAEADVNGKSVWVYTRPK